MSCAMTVRQGRKVSFLCLTLPVGQRRGLTLLAQLLPGPVQPAQACPPSPRSCNPPPPLFDMCRKLLVEPGRSVSPAPRLVWWPATAPQRGRSFSCCRSLGSQAPVASCSGNEAALPTLAGGRGRKPTSHEAVLLAAAPRLRCDMPGAAAWLLRVTCRGLRCSFSSRPGGPP